jgi:hypothetical protein
VYGWVWMCTRVRSCSAIRSDVRAHDQEATLTTTQSSYYRLMRSVASRMQGWETSERKPTQEGGGKSRQFFCYSVSPSGEAKRVIYVQTLQASATEAE